MEDKMDEILCKSCGQKLDKNDLKFQKKLKGTFYCYVKWESKPIGYLCSACGFEGCLTDESHEDA
jgi:hypothetical protein